jgi:hypothetical protein
MPSHSDNTLEFNELDYKQQSSSITAQINNLESQINAHVETAGRENRDANQTLLKCIGQISRMLNSLTRLL